MREYFEKFLDVSEDEMFDKLENKLQKNEKMFIITANPETLMIAEKDNEFKKIVLSNKSTLVADGIGVLKGAKLLNINIKNRVLGVNIASKLIRIL